jgi:imidazolonepropionase-like amidohydrolase
MRHLTAGLLLLFAQFHQGAAAEPEILVFERVTVVDVATGKNIPGQTVVVTGAKISAVVAAEGFKPPDGAKVVPAAGKYLIPGLWDMHVHHTFPWPPLLDLALANGVTGVRDMNSEPFLLGWREEIKAGKRRGPRIVAAGPYLDARLNGQPPNRISVDTPEQAREVVRARKKAGVDFIKVYSGLSPEVHRAVLEEAKAQGFFVAGHCPVRVSAFDAARLGQRSLEHLDGIELTCSQDEAVLRKRLEVTFANPHGYDVEDLLQISLAAMAAPDAKKQTALFAAFKEYRTWQTPTLVTQRPFPPKGAPDERLKYMHPAIVQLWERIQTHAPHEQYRKARTAYSRNIVRAMHQAGVPLLAGTDAGGPMNVRVFPGFSLADELELLVECGLTPADALRTATLNPAQYLGEEKTAGTVAPGKWADLVLLDADPLEAIGNVRKISGVMAQGRWLDRAALDQILATIAAGTGRKH